MSRKLLIFAGSGHVHVVKVRSRTSTSSASKPSLAHGAASCSRMIVVTPSFCNTFAHARGRSFSHPSFSPGAGERGPRKATSLCPIRDMSATPSSSSYRARSNVAARNHPLSIPFCKPMQQSRRVTSKSLSSCVASWNAGRIPGMVSIAFAAAVADM
eukprot:16949-Rhodomonas_salina.1